MYSNGGGGCGDARSAVAPHSRDSSSLLPDHLPTSLWERQSIGRNKFDRSERDKYVSVKKDWALDSRPSSTRSSNTLFANAGSVGPPSKRRALGRHGATYENGRYGSAAGRPSDSGARLWSPSENGKAERDFCSLTGGPSPGYSSSPSTEKPSKDSDGHHFRDLHLSPSESRPGSSPRFEPSPRFDPPSRLYTDGLAARERERSKFGSVPYVWDTSHRDRDFRERAWSRPEYNRRTYSLPKLDSPRDWSGGDRELLEGRIDRYGSSASREPAFSDVLNNSSKEHHRYDWRNRERTLFSGLSSRSSTCAPSSNSYLKEVGTAPACSEVPRAASPPRPSAIQSSVSQEPHHEEVGLTSPKKRPRLTWGQGLAKYEKERVEEDPGPTKKFEGSCHATEEEPCEDVHASSDYQSGPLQNGDISPYHGNSLAAEEQPNDSGGVQSSTQLERRSIPAHDLALSSNTGSVILEASGNEHLEDSRMATGSPRSPNVALAQDATFVITASQPSVLQGVQDFLESYLRERPSVSKEVLTHYVEKAELEIERVEKALMKLDNDLGIHVRKDVGVLQEQIVSMHDTSDATFLMSQAPESESLDRPISVVQPQLLHCENAAAYMDTCAESLPRMHDANVHGQEPFEDGQVPPYTYITTVQVMGDTEIHDVFDAMLENTESSGQLGELQCKGGYSKSDKKVISTGKDAGLAASILLSNKRMAERSLSSLAQLNSPGMDKILKSGKLYGCPQEADTWRFNAESHTRKRKHMEFKVIEEKLARRFTEGVLAVKCRVQKEVWKQKQIGSYPRMEYEKILRVLEGEHKDDSNLTVQQASLNSTGPTVVDVKSEEVQIAQKLRSDFLLENERPFLRMPAMHVGKKERDLHRFETKNALVEDPISAEQERKVSNPWSSEEKKVFLDKYSLFGKDFRRIAAYLEHKTVADCVEFYYRNQKSEEFEKVHRRHQLKKCSDYRSSALYLATTTSVSSRHREGNTAASLEGLTLVAAAAAAMSAPREYPEFPPPRIGLATAACTKASYTLQPWAYSSASSVKGNENKEKAGGKGARSKNNRSKASTKEIFKEWSENERKAFMNGLVMFGKNFYSISQHVGTKTEKQCKLFFSECRNQLGLDQFVERHKLILQPSVAENEIGPPLVKDINIKPATGTGGSLQQQCMVEESSPLTFCAVSDIPSELPQGIHDFEGATEISALESLQEVGHADSTSPERSVCKSATCVFNNVVKQEACTHSDSWDKSFGNGGAGKRFAFNSQINAAHLVEPVQGCSLEESLVCGETLQFKTEPVSVKVEPTLVRNTENGTCDVTPSHIHALCPASAVSALVPNSVPVAPLVQSAQVKDQSSKVMETKVRREPTSWTQEEKDKFVDILKVHGKNWDRLRESLPGKSLTQIKTYFQNSKAKLGFGPEGTANGIGRVSSSRKRKADDSDSSSNAGSGGYNASQKIPAHPDDISLKVCPSIFVPPGGIANHALSTEALMYVNLFSRNSLEDSCTTEKVFHSIGLNPNTSTVHPLFNSAVFASSNLRVSQHSYTHPSQQVVGFQQPPQAPSPLVVVQPMQQPMVSMGIHQAHQLHQQAPPQPAARMLQELSLPAVQHLHKQPALLQSEANQQVLFQQQQQQHVVQQLQEQVTETAVQQQLPHQLLQRQQQQLQMVAQQLPHHHIQQVLSQHQAQANQQAPNQVVSQLPQESSQSACSQLVSVSQPKAANEQLQQQSELFQSQLYQMHTKSPSLLQQHQQTQQLQLLQLHWQQQQAQVQQAQAKQAHHQLSHLQPPNFALLNEQQQQLAVLRGIMQVTGACTEALKQSDPECSDFSKSQQGLCEDLLQPPSVSQIVQAPIKCQAVSECQLRAGDVKLFGQSLLSQPANNQQQSGKVASPSSQIAFSVPPSSFIASRSSVNTPSKLPADALIRGPGWQQTVWPAAPYVNSGSSSVVASVSHGNASLGSGGSESEHHSVQEAVTRMNERLIREAKSKEDGRANEATASVGQVSDRALSRVLLEPATQPSELIWPEHEVSRSHQLVSIDHGISENKCRGQEFSQLPSLAGGQAASQGLPRVLDALVALAEWRLQNANGGSGRLTDDFLSQSWEALQRDPGSLVEAGKAGGSLAQMYAGSREMLQHLRDSLPSLQSPPMHLFSGSNGGGMRAGSSAQLHPSDAQNALVQSSSLLRVHKGEPGVLEVRDTDGRGGAVG